MKHDSVKSQILNFMRNERFAGRELVPAGIIEDYLRKVDGSKGSTTDRRMRELCKAKLIEKDESKGFKRYKLVV